MKLAGIDLPPPMADAVRACRPHFIAAAWFSVLISTLLLTPALYMLQVYDRVVPTGGEMTLLFVTLALAIALLTMASLDALRGRLLVRASARLDAILTPRILHRMLSAGGRENVQAMRDFDTVRQALASPAASALFDLPWTPIFILVCFMFHYTLGLFAIGSIALLLFIARSNQRSTKKTTEAATRAIAASHATEQAAAAYAGTLRGLGMVGAMVSRQRAHRSTGIGGLVTAQLAGSRFTAVSRFIRMFVQSFALGLGALLAIDGKISSGAIIAASILIGRALQPVDALIGGWSTLMSARAALERLAETMRQPGEEDRIRTALPAPQGKLEVEQVGVRGPGGKPILNGVSFSAKPGEILGIVGPSGSGKTTLAKVIAGALTPEIGTVRFDGAQRSDWDPDALGRFVGYLPQEPSLFEGTIKDNIARFEPWLDDGAESVDAEVVEAARQAGVHDLILQLPNGYDTQLGPMGAGLSAGQSQRIALARALYRDPPILILDEPNAFLDAEGEAALGRAVDKARSRGAAILLIAHRKSILETADRLLVLESGRPKMIGPMNDVVVRLSSPGAESAA
ncbi:MAG TPA: type I secretion system permease/ATPase [Sphingomicrobium sp.]|nr:type I secretion system permease/ATPase [Sphingomicrobium sp.]